MLLFFLILARQKLVENSLNYCIVNPLYYAAYFFVSLTLPTKLGGFYFYFVIKVSFEIGHHSTYERNKYIYFQAAFAAVGRSNFNQSKFDII